MKNNPSKLTIIKQLKTYRKIKQKNKKKHSQTILAQNQQAKKHMGKTKENKKKLLWLRTKKQKKRTWEKRNKQTNKKQRCSN